MTRSYNNRKGLRLNGRHTSVHARRHCECHWCALRREKRRWKNSLKILLLREIKIEYL